MATTSASAPAASAACATSAMSPVFGVSFTHSGNDVAARSARTTASVGGRPHRERLAVLLDVRAGDVGLDGRDARHADLGGQVGETFDRRRRDATPPAAASSARYSGSVCSRKYGTPFDGMPIAFSMPLAHLGDARQRDCRSRSSRVIVLVTSAPRRFRSTTWASPSAKVPDAGITGLARARSPIGRLRSVTAAPPAGRTPGRPSRRACGRSRRRR